VADQRQARGNHRSVRSLGASIRSWIASWSDTKPFVWHKTVDAILDSLAVYRQRIQGARTVTVARVAVPARWGLRRSLLDALEKLHLARPLVRSYERALAAKGAVASRGTSADDGLPLPPATLRAQVGPKHADARYFLASGRRHEQLITDVLRDGGTSIEEIDALLDWGCGCGRVLRRWAGLPHTRICGCDIDPRMIEWCSDNLPFAEVTVTELTPPLPYDADTFDLVYAFSVFTHLTETLQHEWMRECLRLLKPGGHLLISTLGEYYLSLDRLNEAEQHSFAEGNLVVLYQESAGTSLCSAYHPPQFVRETLAKDFDFVSFRPAADDGRHDLHLVRKPTGIGATRSTGAR
jgi:SAM-dependent methyltransferase